jgi:uncharacterized protein (TIGR03118 family)
MLDTEHPTRLKLPVLAAALAASSLVVASAAIAQQVGDSATALTYMRKDLVSKSPSTAPTTDPELVNPWGVAFAPTGAFWVNDEGAGVATLYDGAGMKVPSTFTIPVPAGAGGHAGPTGIVSNPTHGFLVPGTTLSALFLFATVEGTISAWAPNLPTRPTDAVLAVDNSKQGASYTGLEFGINAKGGFIYAANFSQARVDVYDATFKPANASLMGDFIDPDIPADYAPFGVHNIAGNLAVTYAKQDPTRHFSVHGAGLGLVDIFDTEGRLLQRLATRGLLNAPWGVALAPAGFGGASGDILVGNFGDGHVLAFGDGGAGTLLLNQSGSALTIQGLWSLIFGGAANSEPRSLFFTAGIHQGRGGVFGTIAPVEPLSSAAP